VNLTFDFSGRTVIVTGGARGIGLALTRFFAEAGAVLAVADVDTEALAAATTDLDAAVALEMDVSDPESVATGIGLVVARTGRIDVVVNNAGILRDRVVWKLTDHDWQAVLGVHLTGTFNVTRAVIPIMREQGYGRIVNVTSYTGLHGNVGQANYAAAKAGIIGFTRNGEGARPVRYHGERHLTQRRDRHGLVHPARPARGAPGAGPDGPLLRAVRGRSRGRLPRLGGGRLHHRRRAPRRRRALHLVLPSRGSKDRCTERARNSAFGAHLDRVHRVAGGGVSAARWCDAIRSHLGPEGPLERVIVTARLGDLEEVERVDDRSRAITSAGTASALSAAAAHRTSGRTS
jgi:hypothetical protein